MRAVLLGTGSPIPDIDRWGPATLIEAGGKRLLIDAGRGSALRIAQLDLPVGSVDAIFLTHFHSDHTVGLPDLWLTGALAGGFGQRKAPFHLIGPTGTRAIMSGLEAAYASDLGIRISEGNANGKGKPVGFETRVEEFGKYGVVYQCDGVIVEAFEVDHGPHIKPAVGYRISCRGRSIVVSGDTRKHDNLVKFGMGADLIVHEVAAARPEFMTFPIMKQIMDQHTTPSEAGEIFSATKPRLAVYTHVVLLANKAVAAPTLDALVDETRSTYTGPLEVGEDLMSIEIGHEVVVRRHCKPDTVRYA